MAAVGILVQADAAGKGAAGIACSSENGPSQHHVFEIKLEVADWNCTDRQRDHQCHLMLQAWQEVRLVPSSARRAISRLASSVSSGRAAAMMAAATSEDDNGGLHFRGFDFKKVERSAI